MSGKWLSSGADEVSDFEIFECCLGCLAFARERRGRVGAAQVQGAENELHAVLAPPHSSTLRPAYHPGTLPARTTSRCSGVIGTQFLHCDELGRREFLWGNCSASVEAAHLEQPGLGVCF